MASIKDVAKRAGVSISTVSLAFNEPERVSEATRKNPQGSKRSYKVTIQGAAFTLKP